MTQQTPTLTDLYAAFCEQLRRFKALPQELRPCDGAELCGHIAESLTCRRLDIAAGQIKELAGWVAQCTSPYPDQTPHQHPAGARLCGPGGVFGTVYRRLAPYRGDPVYWVRLDVADADARPAAGWPFQVGYAVWFESEVRPEREARLETLAARYHALAERVGPFEAAPRELLRLLGRASDALQCARWVTPSADLAARRLQRAVAEVDALERALREPEPPLPFEERAA